MRKVAKKVACLALAASMFLLSGFSAFASEPAKSGEQYKITAEDLGIKAPREVKKGNNLGFVPLSTDRTNEMGKTLRNQIGEPMDHMYFYSMELRPIVEVPETGQIGVLTNYVVGKQKDTRESFYNTYTTAQTTGFYNDVISNGFNMRGWQVKVHFRFDFINPVTWTLSIDGGEGVTENTPYPFNPYQTYNYTYNSFFQSNPLESYRTSFAGSVHYYDKYSSTTKDRNYSAITVFNVN